MDIHIFPQKKMAGTLTKSSEKRTKNVDIIYLRVCAPGVSSLPGDADDVHEVGSTSAW